MFTYLHGTVSKHLKMRKASLFVVQVWQCHLERLCNFKFTSSILRVVYSIIFQQYSYYTDDFIIFPLTHTRSSSEHDIRKIRMAHQRRTYNHCFLPISISDINIDEKETVSNTVDHNADCRRNTTIFWRQQLNESVRTCCLFWIRWKVCFKLCNVLLPLGFSKILISLMGGISHRYPYPTVLISCHDIRKLIYGFW